MPPILRINAFDELSKMVSVKSPNPCDFLKSNTTAQTVQNNKVSCLKNDGDVANLETEFKF